MNSKSDQLLIEVEQYVANWYTENISAEYVYHDYQHIRDVVEAVQLIGEGFDLNEKDLEVLQVAAWFHDTGFDKGAPGHEERSCTYAEAFLQKLDYPPDSIQTVISCILSTKVDIEPGSLLEEILCDADLSHLGSKTYWDRCWRVRQELLMTEDRMMTESEWVQFELAFVLKHQYYTEVAKEMYDKRKEKNINQLKKLNLRMNPNAADSYLPERKKKKKKKKSIRIENETGEINQLNLGRGVETMFRTTYRTHVNLSSIADNKANIMLSINAIIISIVVAQLVPEFSSNKQLIFPTVLLLSVCLTALVFAILATRPKVTEGKFTREDIAQKRSNLLFFGNFYNMDINDFHWGMLEMIKDNDFLYSSMTRDLYYLGVVLAKKYRLLAICYNVFMYGLILSVIVFAIAFAI